MERTERSRAAKRVENRGFREHTWSSRSSRGRDPPTDRPPIVRRGGVIVDNVGRAAVRVAMPKVPELLAMSTRTR
jgi:hypothetical protein